MCIEKPTSFFWGGGEVLRNLTQGLCHADCAPLAGPFGPVCCVLLTVLHSVVQMHFAYTRYIRYIPGLAQSNPKLIYCTVARLCWTCSADEWGVGEREIMKMVAVFAQWWPEYTPQTWGSVWIAFTGQPGCTLCACVLCVCACSLMWDHTLRFLKVEACGCKGVEAEIRRTQDQRLGV